MRPNLPIYLFLFWWPLACVDPVDLTLKGTLNVVVVDGIITNLAEPQVIELNRSTTDPLTGLPRSTAIVGAKVEVIVDSSRVITFSETAAGYYQAPSSFVGQPGHHYQLNFTLKEGTHFQSSSEIMSAVPAIQKVYVQFNPTSLPAKLSDGSNNLYRSAHDFTVSTQDPATEHNYYQWNWKLWEKQSWCQSCAQGVYSIANVITDPYLQPPVYTTGEQTCECCFYPKVPPLDESGVPRFWVYDYSCRTECWEILRNYNLTVFSDEFVNGNHFTSPIVAQIPYYDHDPCLVEIRQQALSLPAYTYFKLLVEQTRETGGIADVTPSLPVGNVRNLTNPAEPVIGFFTASGISMVRYWLDRKDAFGTPPGLFQALNGRSANPEPQPPGRPFVYISDNSSRSRPYKAVCVPSDSRTPYKPVGWQD